MNIVKEIENKKIMVICRGIYGEKLLNLVDALYKGGIRLIEVTFDQSNENAVKDTKNAIKMIIDNFPDMLVGSGTVTKPEHVIATKEAGGAFALSPHVDVEIIKLTIEEGLISIPGATTASEMVAASNAGAPIVKVFPAGWLGLKYIKDIKGPLNHIKFLAAAGINEENIKDYLAAGYGSFGISGRLTDKTLIESGDFEEITRRAKEFVQLVK